jgi:hypothetical protein
MGECLVMQQCLFYVFWLKDHVPYDHLLRSIGHFELRQHPASVSSP